MVLRKLLAVWLVLAGLASVQASPWLEADDPYLRSDVQFLADRGRLVMPTNAFPIRWRLLANALAAIDVPTCHQQKPWPTVMCNIDWTVTAWGEGAVIFD